MFFRSFVPIEQNIRTEDNPFLNTLPLIENESDRRYFSKLPLYYKMSRDVYSDLDDMLLPLFNAIKQETLKTDKAGSVVDDETILREIFEVAETNSSYQSLYRKFKKLTKQPEDEDRESQSLDMSDWCDSCELFHCLLHKPPIKFQRRELPDPIKVEPIEEPCTNHCFLLKSGNGIVVDESMEPEAVWSSSEKSYFNLFHSMFPNHYCRIAQMLKTKTCQEVQKFAFVTICDTKSRRMSTDSASSKSSRSSRRSSKSFAPKWERSKNHRIRAYEPCDHDGICSVGCPCFDNKNFCEVFCGCTDGCSNRYRGLVMMKKTIIFN